MLELATLKKIGKSQKEALLTEGGELEQRTIADQVAAALMLKALSGDVSAARELFDSAYGKITDKVGAKHSYTQMGRVTANMRIEQKP